MQSAIAHFVAASTRLLWMATEGISLGHGKIQKVILDIRYCSNDADEGIWCALSEGTLMSNFRVNEVEEFVVRNGMPRPNVI